MDASGPVEIELKGQVTIDSVMVIFLDDRRY